MRERYWEEVLRNRGKIVGAVAGLTVSLMVMDFGFLWTAFIVGSTYVGYRVGKAMDDHKESILEVLDRFLPPRDR